MFSFTEWNVWLWNKVSREENSWEKAYDMFRKPHKRLLLKSTCKNQSSWREEYGRFHTFYILIWNLKIYLIVFWETQCGLLWSIMWSWMTADILSSKGQTFALKIWWWLHIHHLLPFFSYDRSFKIAETGLKLETIQSSQSFTSKSKNFMHERFQTQGFAIYLTWPPADSNLKSREGKIAVGICGRFNEEL